EEHEVDRCLREGLEGRTATGRGQDFVAWASETTGEHVTVVLVVVHDQDHIAALSRLTPARLRRRLRSRGPVSWGAFRPKERVEALSSRADTVQVRQERARSDV